MDDGKNYVDAVELELGCYSIFSNVLYDINVEVSNCLTIDKNFKK